MITASETRITAAHASSLHPNGHGEGFPGRHTLSRSCWVWLRLLGLGQAQVLSPRGRQRPPGQVSC